MVQAAEATTTRARAGELIRYWRRRRRLSQLDCALDADMSQRHLSFIESGRSVPSREMVHRLSERLDVPLRERNALLVAAGYAPTFAIRSLDDQELAFARRTVELVLTGHGPHPAIAVDRHWTLVSANAAATRLLAVAQDARLLEPPVNVLRLSLHPGGLASRIANLGEWKAHLLSRLARQIQSTSDDVLAALHLELAAMPAPSAFEPANDLIVPLELDTPAGRLSLISTTTVFGTPLDVTISELAIESFLPADAHTSETLGRLAEERE